MVNINILNKLIKGIAEQIPLVNSFYTLSPYESWNVKEVQYGSVSFVVTNVNTREQTTTYDTVIYYADRLTEDNSNLDSIHSDSAVAIQTIVGAINQSDEYITVDYPVGITLFEQSFSDNLAGGYANLTITVEGMGECFDDELSVPEIVATSAYYTKDEIVELFPLRIQLSKVAFSGSFNDLLDIPNLTTELQYNKLVESVSEVKRDASRLETDKLDVMTFNKWVTDFNSGLSGATPLSEFNAFVKGQNEINMNLAVEMKNAVKSQYVDSVIESMKALIGTKASQQAFDNFIATTTSNFNRIQTELDGKVSTGAFNNAVESLNFNISRAVKQTTFDNTILGINNVISNLAVELSDKMDKDYFDGWKDGITNSIDSKVSKQAFDVAMSNIYTKSETDQLINNKVDKVFDEYVKSDSIDSIVTDIVNETIDGIVEDVTEAVRVEIDDIVSEELDSQLGDYVTVDDLETAVSEQYNNYIGSDAFKEEITAVVENTVTDFVGDIVTEAELTSKNYASKYYVDNKFDAASTNLDVAVHDVNTKFGNYYTKSEVDSKISNVTVDLTDYPTKSEISTGYYTKAQVDSKLTTTGNRFNSYYAKSEIDTKLDAINDKIDSIDTGDADVDLTDYPTKSEISANYYNKSQIDIIIDNIAVGDVDLTDYLTKTEIAGLYYTKSETYNRTEIDTKLAEINATIGSINDVLNNVLYTK